MLSVSRVVHVTDSKSGRPLITTCASGIGHRIHGLEICQSRNNKMQIYCQVWAEVTYGSTISGYYRRFHKRWRFSFFFQINDEICIQQCISGLGFRALLILNCSHLSATIGHWLLRSFQLVKPSNVLSTVICYHTPFYSGKIRPYKKNRHPLHRYLVEYLINAISSCVAPNWTQSSQDSAASVGQN